MQEFLLALGSLTTEVFVLCHRLVESAGNTVQDDVDDILVSYLGIDIESIYIVLILLDSTCLFEIADLITSPV